MTNDTPDNLEGKFIWKRDLLFLRAAQQQIAQRSQ